MNHRSANHRSANHRPIRTLKCSLSRRELCAGLAIAAAAASTGGLSGCGNKAKKGPELSIRGMKVGLVLADANDKFNRALADHLKTQVGDQGMELLTEDGKNRASEQIRAVEELIQQQVNILIVQPVDGEKLKTALDAAPTGRTVIIALERPIPHANVTARVGFDQERSGQLAADYLRTVLKSGDTVGILAGSAQIDQSERLAAFKAHLKEKVPGVTVAGEETAASEGEATAALDRLLRSNSSLDAVFALTDKLAVQASKSLRDKGSKRPIVLGYGGSDASIKELALPGSPLALIVTVQPQRVARASIRLALRAVTNKKVARNRFMPPFPVTKENYGSWPDYYGDLPRDAPVPWKTDLILEARSVD